MGPPSSDVDKGDVGAENETPLLLVREVSPEETSDAGCAIGAVRRRFTSFGSSAAFVRRLLPVGAACNASSPFRIQGNVGFALALGHGELQFCTAT